MFLPPIGVLFRICSIKNRDILNCNFNVNNFTDSKIERKRSSRESYSSNSSIADSNQNKRMKLEGKHNNLSRHVHPYKNNIENGLHAEGESPKQDRNMFHGQSESGN